jgi:hypothetical protein
MPARTAFFVAVLAAVLAVAGSGCSLVDGGHDRSSNLRRSAGDPTPSTGAGPTLSTAGSAPRVALRFRLRRGSTAQVAITTDVGVTQAGPAGPQTVDPPPVVQTLRFRVGTVASDGSAEVAFEVTGADVGRGNALSAAEVATYRDALGVLKGIHGTGTLSPLGQFRVDQLAVPPGVSPSVRSQVDALRNQVSNLAPVLPSDAVGVGGSWTAATTTTVGGATVQQSVTYTVTAVDGDRIAYRSMTTATAARQPLALPGLPAGTVATLVSSTLTGTGTGTLDLTSVASKATTVASGTQVVEVATGTGSPTTATQQLTTSSRSQPLS